MPEELPLLVLRTRQPAHQLLGITYEQFLEMGLAAPLYEGLINQLSEEAKQWQKR